MQAYFSLFRYHFVAFILVFRSVFTIFAIAFAELAQLVEQRIRNAWVGGSSPPSGSREDFGLLFFVKKCVRSCVFAIFVVSLRTFACEDENDRL